MSHIEMILSFIIFVGFLIFLFSIFVFLNKIGLEVYSFKKSKRDLLGYQILDSEPPKYKMIVRKLKKTPTKHLLAIDWTNERVRIVGRYTSDWVKGDFSKVKKDRWRHKKKKTRTDKITKSGVIYVAKYN